MQHSSTMSHILFSSYRFFTTSKSSSSKLLVGRSIIFGSEYRIVLHKIPNADRHRRALNFFCLTTRIASWLRIMVFELLIISTLINRNSWVTTCCLKYVSRDENITSSARNGVSLRIRKVFFLLAFAFEPIDGYILRTWRCILLL